MRSVDACLPLSASFKAQKPLFSSSARKSRSQAQDAATIAMVQAKRSAVSSRSFD